MSNLRTVVPAIPVVGLASPPDAPMILLIEDDACVADVVEHLLRRLGMRVLRARDGAEGSQYFARHEQEIELVILDCGLPDVDGVALGRVLRRLAPALPIILMSGWDLEPARALAAEGPAVFLQKPFLPSDVAREVTILLRKNA